MKQKKQEYNWYKLRYTILAVTLLVTALGLYLFSKEVTGGTAERYMDTLLGDSKVFSLFLDEVIENHIDRLEDISLLFGKNVLEDAERTKEKLRERQRDFVTYTLLSTKGEHLFENCPFEGHTASYIISVIDGWPESFMRRIHVVERYARAFAKLIRYPGITDHQIDILQGFNHTLHLVRCPYVILIG